MLDTSYAIHQFTAGTTYGDAVTNSTLYIKDLLKSFGFSTKIYAGHVASELSNDIEWHHNLKPSRNDIVFIHHALGHALGDWLIDLPCRKVLVYHNITPGKFFPKNSPVQSDIKKGHQQLYDFHESGIKNVISISDYNKIDLNKVGYENIKTIPLLFDIREFNAKQWNKKLVTTEKKIPTILFVGRVVQNKCQHELIEVARYLKAISETPFQMILVGNYRKEDAYYQLLMRKIQEYNLHDWVHFTGKVLQEDLYGWYRASHCFVCLSEHEGFGVPVVEAMNFGLPVVGYDSSNIAYLLKNCGLLIKEKKPPAIASLIKLVLENEATRKTIIDKQNEALSQFDPELLKTKLKNFILNLV